MMCADDLAAGSAGGGGGSDWTVALFGERHRSTSVLDNFTHTSCRNTVHVCQKYTTTVTCTIRLRTLGNTEQEAQLLL